VPLRLVGSEMCIRDRRLRSGAALNPVALYRDFSVRQELIKERGTNTVATGL
jgi:L-rhamnose isomerase/sugar isomerase